MSGFEAILATAERRKGGTKALADLLPKVPARSKVRNLADDRVLAEMAKRVFSSGFSWKVIEAKWAGFEDAFRGFDPDALAAQQDGYWNRLKSDTRIVRNAIKIVSVRDNARFVQDVAREHGSFGRMLAKWPATEQAGLLRMLAERGSRLGGKTGQYLLRFLGWDGYVLSKDVVACLRASGLDIADDPKSKGDFERIQARFNAWAAETGRPVAHLSKICAMSVGVNYAPHELTDDEATG